MEKTFYIIPYLGGQPIPFKTQYDSLENHALVGLYYQILTYIFEGRLTNKMFDETELLETIASERGMYLSYYRQVKTGTNKLMILIISHS